MEQKNTFFLSFIFTLFIFSTLNAQQYSYEDNWGLQGLTVKSSTKSTLSLNFSVTEFYLDDVEIDGKNYKSVHMPGVFLPNDAGAPDLPGTGRYIALPQGAVPSFRIVGVRTEILKNIDIAPAPVIPRETDNGPLKYNRDSGIFSKDEFYPSKYVKFSEQTVVRGVNAVILGVTPFQYNPVSKELIIYKDLEIEVDFQGGNGIFGVEKYRSRFWDPILRNIFINQELLPVVNYSNKVNTDATGYEYLIIIPDNPIYVPWADSVKNFRQQQGIKTGVVNLTQIGGNTTTAIENYINNAYNTWDIPPDAILFMADYGTGAATGNGIICPTYSTTYPCISDNFYADVNNDMLPDMAHARIVAQTESHLQIMVKKFIDYERNPPTNPNYYDKPVTAMGWQTERWFQLCSEIINGFWTNVLGKHPVRENAIYSGTQSSWSSNTNTPMILNYFGPSGLNYIPASPSYLTDWGGNATRINNDLNAGAFMITHRDHGLETGWGEPSYRNTDLPGLNNNDLFFVFSMNCLSGKFNWGSECFVEAMHRYPKRALGLISASETSYSFVNDTYAWGMFDYMWPNFMPAYGQPGQPSILPGFANVAGKYFLQQSSWPYNPTNKDETYYLFHEFGDAFSTVYSEMPQNLTITHNPVIISGLTTFDVTANEGSVIALTQNNEILAVAAGTGNPVSLQIPVVTPFSEVLLTVTKQNYYRYSQNLQVIPPSGAYVVHNSCVVNDSVTYNVKMFPGNGVLDYHENAGLTMTVKNLGSQTAENVVVKLRSSDPYITITDSIEVYGNILSDSLKMAWKAFALTVSDTVPNDHSINFTVAATNGVDEWTSGMNLKAYAPILEYAGFSINDSVGGNNNGKIDPGETVVLTVSVKNSGGSQAYNVTGNLIPNNQYLSINSGVQNYGAIDTSQTVSKTFTAVADVNTPPGQTVILDLTIAADYNRSGAGSFNVIIGQIPALIVDVDKNHNSANILQQAILAKGVTAELVTAFPSNLSLYSAIFVCLGTYSQNYKLTTADGQALADYLNAGGMLYMEGGDTWYYDTKTPVHYMFNIQGIADGTGNLNTLLGQAGSMGDGMTFTFSGENNYIDQLNAISPAVVMFKNQSPVYGAMIHYNPGTYRTIGSSFEFGGLVNGTSPSTRDSLAGRMLEFFNLLRIPVELASLNAEVIQNSVKITWETATEINNLGFDVERSTDGKSFVKIGTVKGMGTTTEVSKYSYIDNSINESGLIYYRLKQIDLDGTSAYSGTIEVDYSALPTEFSLSQNYPNPFNPSTTIKFALPKSVRVTLKIYDALGSEVETLINKEMEAGYHQLDWNAGKYSSGMYIYRITAGDFNSVKKMMILK